MKTTTLNKIKICLPSESRWKKLLKHLGKTEADDEPLPFSVIVESNGLDYALWCCRSAPEYDKEWTLYAVWCARQVQHLIADERSLKAIYIAERDANGEAFLWELNAARRAAWAATAEIAANGIATSDAAWSAGAAAATTAENAWEAAREAAKWAAVAGQNARANARDAQKEKFLEMVAQ
jgi:hypothetical protein